MKKGVLRDFLSVETPEVDPILQYFCIIQYITTAHLDLDHQMLYPNQNDGLSSPGSELLAH